MFKALGKLLYDPKRSWRLQDLVCDHHTGKLRETAVWSNIGKAAMVLGFLWKVYHGTDTEWLWGVFGGIVVLHEVSARVMNQRQQVVDNETKPSQLQEHEHGHP